MAGSGGCQSCKGLKDCLVYSAPPYFTPISQMGELRPEHGKGLPTVIHVRRRAGSRCWDLPPQSTLSTKNSFSENFNTSRVSEKCILYLNIESQRNYTLCLDGNYLQDTLGIATSWAVA